MIWLVVFFPLNNLSTFGNDIPAKPVQEICDDNSLDALYDIVSPVDIEDPLYAQNSVEDFIRAFPGISEEALKCGLAGYASLNEQGKLGRNDVITIVDFSKPSTEERLFVINLKSKKIIAKSLCAHGRNSGENYAQKFSNNAESYQSSLGFYVASETYEGAHGYSLKLDGMENGFNNNARERGVVMHGADYVSKAFIKSQGRLGRSEGCPALPIDQYEKIISMIKGGSCLFIYSPDKYYKAHSPILRNYNEASLTQVVASLRG